MADFHAPTDQILLSGILQRMAKLPAESRNIEPLNGLLADSKGIVSAVSGLIARRVWAIQLLLMSA